ncbi:MAG: metal ABC transporter substrate-binding protein [Desulfobacteraceae bacterium]|nr:metal ABC transporter substrate-binding protein [Desulfobacteraceae bacterium]
MKNCLSRFLLLICILLAPATAFGQEARYAATIQPLAAILKEVVGARGEVARVLPPGSSPHTFEPRPSDAVMLQRSLALFYAGPGLDREWTQGLPAPRKVEMLQLVPPEYRLPMVAHHDEEGKGGHGHEHEGSGTIDPHFWTDPLTVRAMLPGLVRQLTEIDPEGRALYERNAAAFAADLDRLNAQVAEILRPVAGKPVFLFHPSFQYLITRYHLNLAGLLEPFPGREPSPKTLNALIEKVTRVHARALFTEPQLPSQPAKVLAEAAGLKLYELDPLGGTKGRQSYNDIILYNARTLREALGGQPSAMSGQR